MQNLSDPTENFAAETTARNTGLSLTDFNHFAREYYARLLAVSTRMLRSPDDAADALQDALLSAWQARESFSGQSTVYTWLFRIVRNSCLMKIRSQSAKKRQLLERAASLDQIAPSCPAFCAHVSDAAESAEVSRSLHSQIDELPTHYRQILLLREIEQRSTRETAKLLSLTPATVKTRLCRARSALRLLLS